MRKKPIRVWFISLFLLILAGTSLYVLSIVVSNPTLSQRLEYDIDKALVGALIPILIIVCTFLFFFGIRYSNYILFFVVLLHLGGIILQNISILNDSNISTSLSNRQTFKVYAPVVRSSLELLIVGWALFSLRTRNYLNDRMP